MRWNGHKRILQYHQYESSMYPWKESNWKVCQRLMVEYQERAKAADEREMHAADEAMKEETEGMYEAMDD